MNKNGTKLYKQGPLNGYTYCIRQIFEENAIGYSHGSGNATKVNSKCHGFSSEEQNGKLGAPVPARLYTSPALVDGPHVVSGRKDQRRQRRAALTLPSEGKLRFADRLRALLKRENHQQPSQAGGAPHDPYDFSEAPAASAAVPGATVLAAQRVPVAAATVGGPGIAPAPVVVSEARRAVENGSHGQQLCAEPHPRPVQPRPAAVPKEVLVQQIQRVPVASSQPLSSMSFAKGTTVFGLAEVKPKVVAAGGSGKPAVCGSVASATSAPPAAKLAKTMNRLQAKIAQNRVLDKLKRAQQDPGQHAAPSSHNHRVVMVSSASPMLVGAAFARVDRQDTAKPATPVARPRERPSRDSRRVRAAPVTVAAPTAATTPLATTSAAAMRNLRRFWNADKNSGSEEAGGSSGTPKLPGSHTAAELDSSGSDSSDDEDSTGERGPSLWNWDLDCSDASTVRSVRSLRIRRLRAELRKRYEVLCKRQAAARPALEKQDALVRHLARAALLCPDAAARLLLEGQQPPSSATGAADRSSKPAKEEKRPCCYQEESGLCQEFALPYTRHCTKHITYNVDQLLFEHCTAKFADNTQCCVPVFDMCHELPLCVEHAKKRDNYNKMASEPKPKKPRKKSKPPALTRPPKRGKKKRAASSGLASPHTAPHSPSSSSFSSSCVPLEVLVQSPASSSSSSSPCSSRSPPFLGGSDSSSNLLLGLATPAAPPAAATLAPSAPPQQQQQPQQPQPLLQAVRIKTEPKASPVAQVLHHPPPCSSSSSPSPSPSSSLAMPVLTSRPLPRPAAQVAPSHLLAPTRTVPAHHTALPVVASPATTAGHLGAAAAGMLPSVTLPSSPSVRLVASGSTAAVTRPVAVNHSHVVAQAVVHPSVAAMEAPPGAPVVGALAGTQITDGYGYVVAAGGMNAEAVAKELVERIEPDLATDLESQFSPDTIEKSLELPLDAAELANQATKLLEEHDFTEVLNKISDDAFSDLFSESKNGEYVPSKEETEELERALAAVSKDVHMARESLAKLSAAGGGAHGEVPDLPDLVDAFPDLPLSSSEINSLTQALMGGEALRTVALLSSAADQGFTLLEQPPAHFGPPTAPAGAMDGTAAAPASSSPAGWLLGAADFGSSSSAGPEVPAGQAGGGAVLPKRSVLAQESVS